MVGITTKLDFAREYILSLRYLNKIEQRGIKILKN